jgi:hypothetical protein
MVGRDCPPELQLKDPKLLGCAPVPYLQHVGLAGG